MSQVLVAMSGGVDSSVAAALCLEAGHDVTGVTLKLWGGPQDSGCCAVSDVDDARRVCQQLGIDHFVFNYTAEFEASVVGPYAQAHRAGDTPNPCVECNRHIKFDLLTRRAEKLGFERVVTGHHVRIDTASCGTQRLRRGADGAKDQSYVLYMLGAEQLEQLEFPVGELTKHEVREHASRLGLRTAGKPDSNDVCFIQAGDGRMEFLAERVGLNAGQLVDTAGRPVGTTDAVELVTIGQRKGLRLGGAGQRRYAVDIDVAERTVTVGTAADLLTCATELHQLQWVDEKAEQTAMNGEVLAQVSAHGTPTIATLEVSDGGNAWLRWKQPQRRVAPGQAVVLYDGDWVLGGGVALRNA